MDDPFQPENPQATRSNLDWHSEQVRRSGDIIRIANPLVVTMFGKPFEVPVEDRRSLSPSFAPNGDYLVEYDTGPDNRPLFYRVPLNGTLEIDRYIADKFRKEMSVHVINYYGNKMGEELRERESRNRPELLLDKHAENKMVWDKVPRTDDEKLLEELWPQFELGIVRVNGLDNVDNSRPPQQADFRSTEERLSAKFENRIAADTTTPPLPLQADLAPVLGVPEPVEPPLYVSKKERERLAKEVTNNGD